MKVLYVAYPMLAVGEESAGGAEQMLWTLEREIARRGHQTAVAACEGSRVSGELVATGTPPVEPDIFDRRNSQHNAAVVEAICKRDLDGTGFDVVHDMSGHFFRVASSLRIPVLATLHLPRSFYAAEAFTNQPANLYFNCVSESQLAIFTDLPNICGVVHNGIALDKLAVQTTKEDYLLWLGRFCEEKGAHIAIEVARRAKRRLIIAGAVYPFSYHQQYFAREIMPRLNVAGSAVEFIDRPDFATKRALLRNASAVLVTSVAPETSSLVAMEAAACGTPVVALATGAIPEVVAHGETGFVVQSPEEIVDALEHVHEISPLVCRAYVEEHFDSRRMASDYEQLYVRVYKQHREVIAA